MRLTPNGYGDVGLYFCRNIYVMQISITKLYDLLTLKLGKETAGHLSYYIQDKIKEEFADKSSFFATKDDVFRLDIKIGETKSELIKWMFVFWIAQAGTTFAFILLFVKK